MLEKLGFGDEEILHHPGKPDEVRTGKCGRCNVGNIYVCKDGPVFTRQAGQGDAAGNISSSSQRDILDYNGSPHCIAEMGAVLFGGPEGDRTLDPSVANAVLSQLSYRGP